MSLPEFQPFPKLARLHREIIITEKIDGTNAQVYIDGDLVLAGSRKRWLTPESDNFGFARWVAEHMEELRDGLGDGAHYGEWWGSGIQRGYGLTEKRFSLFNAVRWGDDRPACCHVVPTLYVGTPKLMFGEYVERALGLLAAEGSVAAPGFMRPEGVVVFHRAAGKMFKVTLENDEQPKSLVA